MAVNKVTIHNADGVEETLIDLTGDTVSPEVLLKGYTATNSKGEKIEGEKTNDADTVDGLHFVVSESEATVDDKSVITFILGE